MRRFFLYSIVWLAAPLLAWAQQDDGDIRLYAQRLQQAQTKTEKLATLQKLTAELATISPAEAIEYAQDGAKIAQDQRQTATQLFFYLQIGIAHFHGETIGKAEQYLQKAAQNKESAPQTRIQALQYLALCARHENDKKTTNQYLETAYKEAEQLGDKILLAQNALFRAEIENSAQALPHYQHALSLYEAARHEVGYARTAQALGDFYAEQMNNPLTALYYYQKALQIADRLAEKRILCNTLNAMGAVQLHHQQDARMALRHYFQAFVIAQEYDFIQNGSKLAQALKGIHLSYQRIARERRNVGETDKARQYDKLADRYQKLWQNLVQADYDVELFGSANPEARTYTSPAPNPDRTRRNTPAETLRKSLRSPIDSHGLLSESRRKADSLVIAQKNSQIDHWQEQTNRHEVQLNHLQDEKTQQEVELRRYKLWWFWGLLGLIGLLLGFLGYAVYHIRLQKRFIAKQKNKVLEAQEKANRYVIVAREHEDLAMQKSAEATQALAMLDDKKLELVSFRKRLQEDVLRYMAQPSGLEKAHYALATLLQERAPQADIRLFKCLPIAEAARASVGEALEARNIGLELGISENLACFCDEALLRAVLVHLFQNSLKYAPQGGHIKLEAYAEGANLCLAYRDNGQGIAQNLHTQAFRKYPAQEARPLASGLYWAKKFIEAQKGTIALLPNAMGLSVSIKLPTDAPQTA